MALVLGVEGVAQVVPPQARYSSHDNSVDLGLGLAFFEGWGDAKSAGDGLTRTFGTIEVHDTRAGVLFSGVAAAPVVGLPSFGPLLTRRQVAMLQFTDAAQVIPPLPANSQFFYYGQTGTQLNPDFTRATNGRGIAVWADADPLEARVVICGETFDERLPMSQAPAGNLFATPTTSSGFIAMLNGNGTLLWTHHAFGTAPSVQNESCAITDVSIRVVKDDAGILHDIVTYCGISSHGNPVGGNGPTLTPVQPFTAPAGGLPCSNPAGGATDNGPGQWDGIVGRLTNVHANPVPAGTIIQFHSIVGGSEQDGLFGIAEAAGERVIAVGSTATGAAAGPGNNTFPLNSGGLCLSSAAQYCLGTVVSFDASGTPGAALVLVQANPIGTTGTTQAPLHTILRDVCVQPNFATASGIDLLVAVGSTDDANAAVTWPSGSGFTGADMTLSGPTDGIVLTGFLAATGFAPLAFTFRGGDGDDGLTGVQGWSEFNDNHIAIGFTDQGAGSFDIDVCSYLVDITTTAPAAPQAVYTMAQSVLGGTGLDLPTAMGPTNATNLGAPGFNTFSLGDHAGGGIAVDQRARVNVVGTTNSLPPGNYPIQPMGAVAGRPRNVVVIPSPNDGVRSVLDMLPANIGRTDGTGPAVPGPMGPYPIAGTTGGTTPFCALVPFGLRIGDPAPGLQRMLIDFDGIPAPGPTTTNVVVDRPTAGALVQIAAMQIGFPNAPGFPPVIMPDGIELWTTNAPAFVLTFGAVNTGPQRFPIPSPLPPSPVTFTVQIAYLQPIATIPGGLGPAPCTMVTTNSSTPALWVSY